MTDAPIFIGGHSLGAADAYLYAWSRLKRGLRVDGIYVFGSPRPGDSKICQDIPTDLLVRSLKNRRDPVTIVPPDIVLPGLVDEEYDQPRPFIQINEPPSTSDPWGLMADHHFELYRAGAHKLPPVGAVLEIDDAADLVQRLYDTADGWNWISTTDGLYWAVKVMPNGARFVIRRGSTTRYDWWNEDFEFDQIPVMGARVSQGFWKGVAPIQDQLDQVLA